MRGLAYWYKPQTSSVYINVSKHVDEQVKGGEAINETPGNFSFTLKTPLDQDNNYITISSGDEFAITENELNIKLIIHGQVVDPGIDILGWNNLLNKPYFKFDVVCVQKDFSLALIDSINFTDTNLSTILDEIMSYTDDSLGSISLQKYRVNFEDYIISSFSVEKKSSREALTDLVEQIDSFWSLKYLVEVDLVNTLFITRYIEISNKNGITPEISSIWEGGITTNSTKRGTILNPIEANRFFMQNIAAEIEAKLKKDISVMCNFIELSAKIYSLGNSESLTRFDFPAAPNKFDYDLNGYASDIVYVAFALKDPKDPVKILFSSTTTIIKITSRFATSIKIGDIAYFKDDSPNNFYTVISVNKININITEIGFDTLPFTPVENNAFEIVSNTEIFEEKYDLNYSQKGVVKYTNKDQVGKLKFLDLSEPPPGIFVTIFYKKIQDQKVILKNDESIRKMGLMYKEVKLDDDMIFTQEELNNLASKLLVLEPKLSFSITSRRYGLAPIGLSIPIIINGFINTNFILEKNEWQFVGIDPQKMNIFSNKLFFSNMINTPESYIKALKRRKATKSGVTLAKDIIKETLKLIETISFNTTGLLIPTALPATNINTTTHFFRINFLSTNATRYIVYIAIDASFTLYTAYELDSTSPSGTNLFLDYSYNPSVSTYYYKIKAVSPTSGEESEFSNIITVDLIALSSKIFINLKNNSLLDISGNNNDLNLGNGATFTSNPILSGDTTSVFLDGINDYAYVNHDTSFDSVDFTFEFAFKIHNLSSFIVLVSRFDNPLNNSNTQFYSSIINDKLSIFMYDASYNQDHNYTEIVSTSINSFATNTEYIAQFSYNNSSKTAILVLNRNNVPISINATANAGVISLAALNLKSTAITRILLGAYIDGTGVTAGGSYLRVGRLRYWTKSHTLGELQALYDNLITT